MITKVSEDLLRAATTLAAATFVFEKAVQDGDRFAARQALEQIKDSRNNAANASAIMWRAFEVMPR